MKSTKIIHAVKSCVFQTRQLFPVIRILEAIAFGTQLRADILNWLLKQYYLSKFRRDWKFSATPPHFEDNRCFLNLWCVNGDHWPLGRNPDFLTRGLLNREVMPTGCRVLDIGCGDGFFDYLFYSGVASHIDALDIEESAISLAEKYHQASNITYYVRDCVKQDFPKESYDVVVWDGAIGHFTEAEVATIMSKIQRVLGERGILVGSEALEPVERKSRESSHRESSYWDHYLAFFEAVDLKHFLEAFLPHVLVKEIPPIRGRYREVYFRCGYDLERLRGYPWQ